MRYLKLFNESLEEDEIIELESFCNNSLAYLIDEGFSLTVYKLGGYNAERTRKDPKGETFVTLGFDGPTDSLSFQWDQIKDHYIPFIKLISNRYKLSIHSNIYEGPVLFLFANDENEFVSIEDVVNDKFDDLFWHFDSQALWGITIKVLNKL